MSHAATRSSGWFGSYSGPSLHLPTGVHTNISTFDYMVYVTIAILFFNLGVSYMQLKYKN